MCFRKSLICLYMFSMLFLLFMPFMLVKFSCKKNNKSLKLVLITSTIILLFFPKIAMRTFIVVSSGTKFCHGAIIVLLSANPTFYHICQYFRITIKVFLYLIHFVWMFAFKSLVFFMLLHNWQRGLSPLHGLHLLTSSISGGVALTKCDFKFLLFLKPIIGTSGNTFLWSSSQTRITCNSSNWLFKCWNTG